MKGAPDRRQKRAPGGTLLRNVRRGFQSRATRDLFDEAVKHGWSWKLNGSTHVELTPPSGGGKPIILSTTIKGDPPFLADARKRVAEEGWR